MSTRRPAASSLQVSPPPPARRRGRRTEGELRQRREALYRQHLMEVAERSFAEHGFEAARMQDIAAAAGVSLTRLYQFWPGKAELYRAVLIERDRQMLEQVERRARQVLREPFAVEQVLRLMETHVRFLMQHPEYLRLQLREGHAWYDRAARPTAEEQQMWERGLANFRQVLGLGAKRGIFHGADPDEQARIVLAAQQARFANWVLDGMRRGEDEVIAGMQADFVRLCCRPELVVRLLDREGTRLRDETRARIRALAAPGA